MFPQIWHRPMAPSGLAALATLIGFGFAVPMDASSKGESKRTRRGPLEPAPRNWIVTYTPKEKRIQRPDGQFAALLKTLLPRDATTD
jgi:hypothetical protein